LNLISISKGNIHNNDDFTIRKSWLKASFPQLVISIQDFHINYRK